MAVCMLERHESRRFSVPEARGLRTRKTGRKPSVRLKQCSPGESLARVHVVRMKRPNLIWLAVVTAEGVDTLVRGTAELAHMGWLPLLPTLFHSDSSLLNRAGHI